MEHKPIRIRIRIGQDGSYHAIQSMPPKKRARMIFEEQQVVAPGSEAGAPMGGPVPPFAADTAALAAPGAVGADAGPAGLLNANAGADGAAAGAEGGGGGAGAFGRGGGGGGRGRGRGRGKGKAKEMPAIVYSFKNPDYERKKKTHRWKTLKQMVAAEREQHLKWPVHVPTYATIEAPYSLLPPKKFCDVSGFAAKYTEPHTKLRYASTVEFNLIRGLSDQAVQELLAIRKANITLK
jgi:INO80 complex subunit C